VQTSIVINMLIAKERHVDINLALDLRLMEDFKWLTIRQKSD